MDFQKVEGKVKYFDDFYTECLTNEYTELYMS